ncbi:chitin deacetylase 1 [Mycotypha africana]|uniref:chitin deacetylase 1 n=1 Tax=Mycotypha africana TaxID=64632 RepID=UPI0023008A01|nr:chitin deacetylase 1 [Mycotypha africana]KAI8973257.1 chitin deacetylase 1 [Mycotypha africana]
MVWKVALLSAASVLGVNAVTTNYTSITNPLNVTIPNIPQTTSHDEVTQCTYYQSPFTINQAEWPTVWGTATSNGMNNTAEFKALYNSIDWSKAPNIPVRQVNAEGGLVTEGYDAANDPDCWWSVAQCTQPKREGINPDIRNCPEPETWGLTFDDGPNCSHNAFYDFLQEKKQKATMFYIGSNVLNWPYQALRGVKDGHHIAAHTWSHKMMTTLPNEEVLAELYYTQKAIKYVTGVTPKHWRPALGDLDDRVRWIATQLNLTAVIWNLDTFDWAADVAEGITTATVENYYNQYIEMGKNGSFTNSGNIVLAHEINNNTMSFFMKYYPEIKKAYNHVVDVATCYNITHPYVEEQITWAPFGANQGANTTSNASAKADMSATKSGANASAKVNGALFIAAIFGLFMLF